MGTTRILLREYGKKTVREVVTKKGVG